MVLDRYCGADDRVSGFGQEYETRNLLIRAPDVQLECANGVIPLIFRAIS